MSAERPKVGGPVGSLAEAPVDWLVFFAVKEEAKFFLPLPFCRLQVWLTGMGRRNAIENFRYAVEMLRPRRVLTCGFAGGLNPAYATGTVLFDADFDAGVADAIERTGGRRAVFHCATRVAVTARDKQKLRQETNADAVEMESAVIRELCRQKEIPSATIRVISDAANEDLLLDFNALMTADGRLSYFKLMRALIAAPSNVPRLISFQRQVMASARELARVVEASTRPACSGGGQIAV